MHANESSYMCKKQWCQKGLDVIQIQFILEKLSGSGEY